MFLSCELRDFSKCNIFHDKFRQKIAPIRQKNVLTFYLILEQPKEP